MQAQLHFRRPPFMRPALRLLPCSSLPAALSSHDVRADWEPERLERFMLHGRDWTAVQHFYMRLVAGSVKLEQLGLRNSGDYQLSAETTVLPADGFGRGTGSEPLYGPGSAQVLMDGPAANPPDAAGGQETPGPCCEAQRPAPEHGEDLEQEVGQSEGEAARSAAQKRPKDKRPRVTYQVELCYFGPAFCGWMAQPGGLPTVEGAVVSGIKDIVPHGTNRSSISSAGRTDKGVTAVAQVMSFYTREDLAADAIAAAFRRQAPDFLRVVSVRRRPRSFHATFAAQWRRYVYLFPLRSNVAGPATDATSSAAADDACDVDACLVGEMLHELVGKKLDYTALARDTPPGKACECTIQLAKAKVVEMPDASGATRALCIELVADRFLRRMVRILVSTVVQLAARRSTGSLEANASESLTQEDAGALLRLVASCDRSASARWPGPALGLCFAGVGYDDVKP